MESNKESDIVDKAINDYEILRDDYPTYDLAFKIIIIGDSGKKYILKNIKNIIQELENLAFHYKPLKKDFKVIIY